MPNYPSDFNDTVVYQGVDLYVPKDCSVTVFEDSRVFLSGEWYLNGQPLMSGSGAVSGQEVTVSSVQPTDPGISLWFDTSTGYGLLKVKVSGSWKPTDDPAGSIDANEVFIQSTQPASTGAELWVDTTVVPENLKAKVGGSWKSINSEVAVSDTQPTDPAIELWVDTASAVTNPYPVNYAAAGNALGIVAMGSIPTSVVIPNGSITQVTSNLAFTMLIGRRYRIYIGVRAIGPNTAVSNISAFNLRDGTTNYPNASTVVLSVPASTSQFTYFTYSWLLDGDGVARVFNVATGSSTGPLTLYPENSSFYIEDVGPNVSPVLPVPATAARLQVQTFNFPASIAISTSSVQLLPLTLITGDSLMDIITVPTPSGWTGDNTKCLAFKQPGIYEIMGNLLLASTATLTASTGVLSYFKRDGTGPAGLVLGTQGSNMPVFYNSMVVFDSGLIQVDSSNIAVLVGALITPSMSTWSSPGILQVKKLSA